jgi:Tfp pilus assembly protein PilV
VRVVDRSAFTIAETMVAVSMLSVGVLALVGSAALTNRMLANGRHSTRAGQVAAARIERLRQIAFSTAPACTGADWRSGSAVGPGIAETWQIVDGVGPVRRVMVVVRSRRAGSSDTIVSGVLCGPP